MLRSRGLLALVGQGELTANGIAHVDTYGHTRTDTQTGPMSMPTWASCPSLHGLRGLHSACDSPLYTTPCLAHPFHVSLAGSVESQLRGPQPCPSKRTRVRGTGKPPSSVVQCSQAGQGQTLSWRVSGLLGWQRTEKGRRSGSGAEAAERRLFVQRSQPGVGREGREWQEVTWI